MTGPKFSFTMVSIKRQVLVVASDIKSRNSVLSLDGLETHFGCVGLGLVGWCLCLGLGVLVVANDVKSRNSV